MLIFAGMKRKDKYSALTDNELVAAIMADDRDAYEAAFLRHFPHVKQFLVSLVKDPALAEDLSQEIFVKLWLHRDRLDASKSLKNWLFVLSRNAALDVFKSKRNLVMTVAATLPEREADVKADQGAELRDVQDDLRRGVASMPPQRQLIFRLSRFQHLSNAEIARTLNLSVRTVEKHIELALKDLRTNFN